VTQFFLIRHGAHDLQDKVFVGRSPGVHLSAKGREEAERLAERLAGTAIAALYASPRERARETAQPLAARLGLTVAVEAALDELDLGDWTNREMASLAGDEWFRRFNALRSLTPPPGGEWALDVQHRAVAFIERLRRERPDETVAVVSHSDVIKAAIAYYLGVPLDLFRRIEVAPGSLSLLEVADWGARLLLLNEVPPERGGG
jgi:broad specificity phosphatase PhoE